MNYVPLSRCLIFCKRALSVTILYSSLLCSVSPFCLPCRVDASELETEQLQMLLDQGRIKNTLMQNYLATAARSGSYTIDAQNKVTVSPDSYTNVVFGNGFMPSSAPRVNFGAGEVTLTGGPNVLLLPTLSSYQNTSSNQYTRTYPIQINPGNGNATLVLVEGLIEGNVGITSSRPTTNTALLQIGSGNSVNGSVEIKGLVDAFLSNVPNSIIRTSGANLVVDGSIGSSDSTGSPRHNLGSVEALMGNITVKADPDIKYGSGSLNGVTVVVGNNMAVDIGHTSHIRHLFLNEGATFQTTGTSQGVVSDRNTGRIDIESALDGINGKMSIGSTLESKRDNVGIYGGVQNGAGQINAGLHIMAYPVLQSSDTHLNDEAMMADISQNSSGSLILNAGGDITAGNISVESVTASGGLGSDYGGDIVAGTKLGRNTSKTGLAYTGHAGNTDFYYPRGTINAQTVRAPNGKVMAGELNISGGVTPVLEAANLFVVKNSTLTITPTSGSNYVLPSSTGDLTLNGASFNLSGEVLPASSSTGFNLGGVYIGYGSQVDGDLKATGNKTSSYTSLNVQGTTSIDSGSISGDLLKTNKAEFGNVTTNTVNDTLDVATTLAISGHTTNSVKNTLVGSDATITGGSYAGEYFSAANAKFINVAKIELKGAVEENKSNLEAGKIEIGIEGKETSSIDSVHASQSFAFSGGNFQGQTLSSEGNASFTGTGSRTVNKAEVADSFTVTGGNYAGQSLHAKTANFVNLNNLGSTDKVFGEIVADNLNIALLVNGAANIANAEANESLALSGGNYNASNLVSKKDASLANFKTLNVSGNMKVAGMLSGSGSGSASFKQLDVGGATTFTGGSWTVASFGTGLSSGQGGDVTIKDASFNFGADSSEKTLVHGSFTSTGNVSGKFGSVEVDKALSISGGSLVASDISSASADFANLKQLTVDKMLNVSGDMNISGTQSANVEAATVEGKTTISGGTYGGSNLKAAEATFTNLNSLAIKNELAAESVGISLADKGTGSAGKLTAEKTLTINGGSSFTAASLTAGGNSSFANILVLQL